MIERDAVAVAALLYGIGKFWQRTGQEADSFDETKKSSIGLEESYLLWSELFFERFVKPRLIEFSKTDFLSEFHYRPIVRPDISKTQADDIPLIIQEADRLATYSGPERAEDKAKGLQLQNRLESVTASIAITDDGKEWLRENRLRKYHPLIALSLSEKVFPAELSQEQARLSSEEEYKTLWEEFTGEYRLLPAGAFRAYFDSLLFLLHKYTWSVPSGVLISNPAISLYDLSRVTAALAVCLYEVRREASKPEKEFLLIEGDISGIQDFIYNPAFNGQELQDGMARRLRGRSFYLNLLLKTLTDYLIEELDLYSANALWATGGHFLIIAPNTKALRDRLDQSRKQIQQWIWREFRGALGISIANCAASRDDIKNFTAMREELGLATSRLKLQQLTMPLSFDEAPDEAWQDSWVLRMQTSICRDTGRDISSEQLEISHEYQTDAETPDPPPRSPQSLHFDRLGHALIKARTVQLRRDPDWNIEGLKVARLPLELKNVQRSIEANENVLIQFPILNRTWLVSSAAKPRSDAALCLRIADYNNQLIEFLPSESSNPAPNVAQGFLMLADAVKTKKEKGRDVIVDFHELADEADGANFLGVLRMDVDNLSYVFAQGLPKNERSISKIANLSQMMDWFFSGYINLLAAGEKPHTTKEKNLYTTYAGGDDLFITGAWNEIVDLAEKIRADFKLFCGGNPDLHISAGIELCKGKFPVGRAAQYAGQKLNNIAKTSKRRFLDGDQIKEVDGETDKDSLAFLERKISWDRWDEIRKLADKLIAAIEAEDKKISRKFVYNLLELYLLHIDPQRDPTKEWDDPDFIWVPRFLYSLVRNVTDKALRIELQDSIVRQKYYLSVLAGYVSLQIREKQQKSQED